MVSRRSVLRHLAAGSVVGTFGRRGVSTGAGAVEEPSGRLRITPQSVRYDEEFAVRVAGAPAETTVTLTAKMLDREGRAWGSFGRFVSSSEGIVDTTEDAPVDGTYHTVSPMGLIWSMRPVDESVSIYVPPMGLHDVTVRAHIDGQQVDQQTVTRLFGPRTLRTRQSPEGLVGTLFHPGGKGPYPGIIVLHGSGGQPDVGTALMLAAHGYAAFAPKYFGSPEALPDQLAEVPVEYLQRGYDWMRRLRAVRNGPVGLFGGSKGAELALLAGATYDWVGAVAAYAPSGLVWSGLTYGGEETSSWTLENEPVPYVSTAFPPSVVGDYVASWPLGEPVSLRPTYEVGLERATEAEVEAATIHVEDIDGPVTLVSGGDDRLWPSVQLGELVAKRLRDHNHPYAVRHLPTWQAGHAISFPYQPTTGLTAFGGPFPGSTTALGGTPHGLARAAENTWPVVLSTFEEGLQ
jgi:hypothetical protein